MKVVHHGGRVTLDEVDHFSLETMPSYHELRLVFSDIRLADERPAEYPVPDEKLIDEFGQYKKAEWPGKTKDFADLKAKLEKAATLSDSFLRSDWSVWGGWKNKKLKNGTGFFSSFKDGKKWWLTDPEGYAFFSIGPCGTVVRSDCRVDGLEKLMDWLPRKTILTTGTCTLKIPA
jgi:phytoene dehydrogenase-like protein